MPASTCCRGRSAASTPLRARNPTLRRLRAARVWTLVRVDSIAIQPDLPGHKSEPVRSFRTPGFRPAVPASSPLRARNPTPRRLGAARVWTLARVDSIAIQPDLTGHKSEPVRSFRVPGFCGACALSLQCCRFLKSCRQGGSIGCCAKQEMLAAYSPARPASRSAAFFYQSRAGTSRRSSALISAEKNTSIPRKSDNAQSNVKSE